MPSAATLGPYGLTLQVWKPRDLYEGLFDESPTLGLVKKDETLAEDTRWVSVGYGSSQGIAPGFATAKQWKSASKSVKFGVSTHSLYGIVSLDGKLVRTWKYGGDDAILTDPIKREGDNMLQTMKNRLSKAIHGNGVNVLGRMTAGSSPTTTNVITLTNPYDLRNFMPDMPVEFESTGATGGTVKSGVAIVSAVGTEDNPTVTFVGTKVSDAVPTIAASDYLYAVGTYDTPVLYGWDSWNPQHTGSPGTFLGVNRNVAADWLAGRCLDGRGKLVAQRIMMASRICADSGGKMDTYFLSTRNYETLRFQLGASVVNTKMPAAPVGSIKIGVEFNGVEVTGVRGPIKVFADPWMTDDVERGGELSSLYLGSMGPFIHWIESNSPKDMRTEDGADAVEFRAVGDIAFVNERPGRWVRVQAA